MGFFHENYTLAYLTFLSSAPSLAAGFFRILSLLSLSVLVTLQCFIRVLEDQLFRLAFRTEFEKHTLQQWVTRNLVLGLFQKLSYIYGKNLIIGCFFCCFTAFVSQLKEAIGSKVFGNVIYGI